MDEIKVDNVLASVTKFEQIADRFVDYGIELVKNLVLAVIVYIIGRWIFNKLNRILSGIMVKRKMDSSLRTFLSSLINITATIILIIIVISILGIDTSSFIALFASAGVAVGLALSGTPYRILQEV